MGIDDEIEIEIDLDGEPAKSALPGQVTKTFMAKCPLNHYSGDIRRHYASAITYVDLSDVAQSPLVDFASECRRG